MTRLITLLAVVVVAFAFFGCSNSTNPATPDITDMREASSSSPALWAYYDIYLDPEAQTMEAVLNRNVMLTVNIVKILNKNPAALGFSFNGTEVGPGYLDVSLDLSITHPFGGNPGLNGYDVRGILCTNGTETLETNSDLIYPSLSGPSQTITNADGYTRWFNPLEFVSPGLFGYTDGIAKSKNFDGTCTLNPFKYFASGILADDDAYDFLVANSDASGTFASGAEVARTYEIRFGLPNPGIQYGYAIMANWDGVAPGDHPANSDEAIAISVDVEPSLWFTDGSNSGGNLLLDIFIFGWADQPDQIHIESTVLSAAYSLTAGEMTPTDSGDFWASYHVEIPGDNITGVDEQEFWVLCEHAGLEYLAYATGSDNVIVAQRFGLFINDVEYNVPPVINSGVDGPENPYEDSTDDYFVTATDGNDDPLTYDWVVTISGTSTVVFSGPGDGAGQLTIDWLADIGASVDDVYDIDCAVSDGIAPAVEATTLIITVIEPPNEPPIVTSGVLGNSEPELDGVEDYTVTAEDPEMDPLTYDWSVRDVLLGVVFSGPGDGAGTFTVDWANDVGAEIDDIYLVECIVSDPTNESMGVPLFVLFQ